MKSVRLDLEAASGATKVSCFHFYIFANTSVSIAFFCAFKSEDKLRGNTGVTPPRMT